MMDVELRRECKSLLDQLKSSQSELNKKVNLKSQSQLSPISKVKLANFARDLTTQLNKKSPDEFSPKSLHARRKLAASSQIPTQSKFRNDSEKENQNNYNDNAQAFNSNSDLENYQFDSFKKSGLTTKNDGILRDRDTMDPSWHAATPNTIRRRKLIDRHTLVPTKLDSEELRRLDDERRLNFTYSHISVDDDVTHVKLDPECKDKIKHKPSNHEQNQEDSCQNLSKQNIHKQFKQQLEDEGNSRQVNALVKNASIKPKTILNSNSYYSLASRKKNSSVRFDTSTEDATTPDQCLLGYDWIAALLDNDPALVDQSESFFDELKDFRRAYKDECSNQFYMRTPYNLVDLEPEPVAEALAQPKVRPYIVNDRLFTEPFRPGLIDYGDTDSASKKQKEPTKDNPRFVRVSIPRSTLTTPYRVKPHRRGSFDASDSCSLMDHCLLGWENSRPEMIPTAEYLDLNTEAGTRVDSETTTLAEAERLARKGNEKHWAFGKPSCRLQTLPTWRRQYMNTTMNMSLPSRNTSTDTSANGSSSFVPDGSRRATDKLLSATYSNMYEMERLKIERELEKQRNYESEKFDSSSKL